MSREVRAKLFDIGSRFSGLFCLAVLGGILVALFGAGLPALDISFLSEPASDFGTSGGVRYQILGSALLVLGAVIVSAPLALGTAIFKSEFLRADPASRIGEMMLQVMNGIPSIIYGIFGLIFFVNFLNTGISWIAGAFILAFMILPTVTLSTFNSMKSIPLDQREAAFSLGLDRWEWIAKVLVPKGGQGLLTGVLLGMARAIGETAPIMFIATAFSGVGAPTSLFDPVTALPTHILALAQQAADPEALHQAWGSSLVLVLGVMLFGSSGLLLRHRYRSFEGT